MMGLLALKHVSGKARCRRPKIDAALDRNAVLIEGNGGQLF